jgi:lysophospholipase L1-like esterase
VAKEQKTMEQTDKTKKITIVAFGDSLTVGHQSPTIRTPWFQDTPYAEFLEKMITAYQTRFIVKGINGELTSQMLERFQEDVLDKKPNYVIILGGSNDLGWGVGVQAIMDNLLTMYQQAIAAGIQPIAVTVPSIRGYDPLIPPRIALNNKIQETCKKLAMPCIDLFTATAEPKTQRLAEVYSNDGLHLTTRGYQLLAEKLYHEFFKNLQP